VQLVSSGDVASTGLKFVFVMWQARHALRRSASREYWLKCLEAQPFVELVLGLVPNYFGLGTLDDAFHFNRIGLCEAIGTARLQVGDLADDFVVLLLLPV
jgi:hypothetical protein